VEDRTSISSLVFSLHSAGLLQGNIRNSQKLL